MDGVRTKMMVKDPEAADRVKLMFEMYADPDTSFEDITRYFAQQDISFDGKELQRATLSFLLRNPVSHRLTWSYTSSSKDRAQTL